jgi:hypothetical protein
MSPVVVYCVELWFLKAFMVGLLGAAKYDVILTGWDLHLMNLWFWGFENLQNQETSGFGFLKNFKEPTGFMKDLAV